MENVEVGWAAFSSGGPPNFVMFPVGSDIGNPPAISTSKVSAFA